MQIHVSRLKFKFSIFMTWWRQWSSLKFYAKKIEFYKKWVFVKLLQPDTIVKRLKDCWKQCVTKTTHTHLHRCHEVLCLNISQVRWKHDFFIIRGADVTRLPRADVMTPCRADGPIQLAKTYLEACTMPGPISSIKLVMSLPVSSFPITYICMLSLVGN